MKPYLHPEKSLPQVEIEKGDLRRISMERQDGELLHMPELVIWLEPGANQLGGLSGHASLTIVQHPASKVLRYVEKDAETRWERGEPGFTIWLNSYHFKTGSITDYAFQHVQKCIDGGVKAREINLRLNELIVAFLEEAEFYGSPVRNLTWYQFDQWAPYFPGEKRQIHWVITPGPSAKWLEYRETFADYWLDHVWCSHEEGEI